MYLYNDKETTSLLITQVTTALTWSSSLSAAVAWDLISLFGVVSRLLTDVPFPLSKNHNVYEYNTEEVYILWLVIQTMSHR